MSPSWYTETENTAAEKHTFLREQPLVMCADTNSMPAPDCPAVCWQWGHADVTASGKDVLEGHSSPTPIFLISQNLYLVLNENIWHAKIGRHTTKCLTIISQNCQSHKKPDKDYHTAERGNDKQHYTWCCNLEKILEQKNNDIHTKTRQI